MLVVTSRRLELRARDAAATIAVWVDFLEGPLGYRLKRDTNRRQPLARACGLAAHPAPVIVDATAGLGRDAAVLASLGARVTMIERSPVVAALLDDGLKRARGQPGDGGDVVAHLDLIQDDAIHCLERMPTNRRPQVVYLDPMFPARSKSARVKKEMQLLQGLLGGDRDSRHLLHAALGAATWRVVVKRPRRAPPLDGALPSHSLSGKTTRYDVYLTTGVSGRPRSP